jgi:hypothetical protein
LADGKTFDDYKNRLTEKLLTITKTFDKLQKTFDDYKNRLTEKLLTITKIV